MTNGVKHRKGGAWSTGHCTSKGRGRPSRRPSMLTPMRRVVTGHHDAGRSRVVFDGPSRSTVEHPVRSGTGLTALWITESTPARNVGQADAADRSIRLEPPPNGS